MEKINNFSDIRKCYPIWDSNPEPESCWFLAQKFKCIFYKNNRNFYETFKHALHSRKNRTWKKLLPSLGFKPGTFRFLLCVVYSTFILSENLKLFPKIRFSEKFKIASLNVWDKNKKIRIFKCHNYLENLNFSAKNHDFE